MTALDWAVDLLRCPVCGGRLRLAVDAGCTDQGRLLHENGGCTEEYPVIDGVPRVLVGPHRAVLLRQRADWFGASPARAALAERWSGAAREDAAVSAFDAEWSRFDAAGSSELRRIFDLYFDVVPADRFAPVCTVLDAGCGAGRWAVEVAARGPRVLAVDLGRSVELARRNAADSERIACVQADLRALPVADAAVDWAYSLGVLHHLDAPASALRNVVRAARPGGLVLLYLYYALEGRGPLYRALFRVVDGMRRVTSRAPRALLRLISDLIALVVYWPLARTSALLARSGLRGVADAIPLSFYRDRSLQIMRNDSLDRFGTQVEHRYTRAGMERLMKGAGLSLIRFSEAAPYWHAVGERER